MFASLWKGLKNWASPQTVEELTPVPKPEQSEWMGLTPVPRLHQAPKPIKPNINLESLPQDGLISGYGVHSPHHEDRLDPYQEDLEKKFEMWKSRITRK